jgi:hypothetical protein
MLMERGINNEQTSKYSTHIRLTISKISGLVPSASDCNCNIISI